MKHKICLKFPVKTPESCHWHCSGAFIVNFEQISHSVLVFLLLTLKSMVMALAKRNHCYSNVYIINFEHMLLFLLVPFCTHQKKIHAQSVSNRNTRKKCEIFSKLTIKTQEQYHWHRSGVFILLSTLNM